MRAQEQDRALLRFAHHELRLAWRDWSWLFSGRRNRSNRRAMIGLAVFAVLMHLFAWGLLWRFFAEGGIMGQSALATISVSVLLSFAMILSQSLESVTRAFYARDDLDLILSSPAPSQDLFLVRIAMMAVTSWVMSVLMTAPFIHIAAVLDGPHWLSGYAVMLAISLLATGVAILIALTLFRTVGAERTRTIAQIAAAVVGAAFLIGLQVVAIISYGSMSRLALFDPEVLAAHAPPVDSSLWFLADAASGQVAPLLMLLLVCGAVFVVCALRGAVQFRRIVVAALGVADRMRRQSRARPGFLLRGTRDTLIRKELKLIARDPWLISQTLMQVFYLVPPALMLWISYGKNAEVSVLVAPVIVMAVGQLAGGLAWLTISGEDAPDLIATAPVADGARLRAKVLAVLAIVSLLIAPLAVALTFVSWWGGAVTYVGALSAAACAILVQLWFRSQAKRTMFRRRQVASKVSTFAEAAASIACAATTAMVVAQTPLAVLPATFLAIVMLLAWGLGPKRDGVRRAGCRRECGG